ncbi:hypothetical protein PORCAN_249 [Porphyromonas crevioricanis JCM 13913]|nr:hypothetical protein PORCAN_249 [Porphyromonas crevioricanis JCM 13913]
MGGVNRCMLKDLLNLYNALYLITFFCRNTAKKLSLGLHEVRCR